LEKFRRQSGTKVYSAQYLQTPVPDGGTVFDWKWFRFFDAMNPPQFDFVFQSWDIASSISDTADYSVCTTWGVIRTDAFYLLDVRRVRKTRSSLLELAKQLHDKYAPDIIVVETTGLGDFWRSLAEVIGQRVVPEIPKGDKIFRADGQIAHLEEGCVFVPREAQWLDEFRREIIAFPSGKHDDQVDSMVQFLKLSKPLITRALRLGRRHLTDRQFEIKPTGPVVTVKLLGGERRLRPFNSLFRD
jgi:predicted phage terminase large subunit-like protein